MRMGEGKRDRSHRDYREREREGAGKNQRRRGNDRDAKTGDELVVYRILCPDSVIGSVIGKSGKVINSIRQDTNAKVKVVDPFPGSRDRVITIYCHISNKKEVEVDDEFDDDEPLCPAQNALGKVHAVISNMVASLRDSDKRREKEERVECRILVPSSQSASIIGKSGSTIKRLRNKSRANIKVVPKDVGDPAHSCAMEFDNFVLITGDPEAVKKALFAVSAIMYKFTPKEDIPLETNVPEAPPIIIIPSDDSMYHASGFYPPVDHNAASSGFPPVVSAMPISDIQGGNWPIYSSAAPVVSGYGASRTEELILRVLCPSDKIGRVIGKGGSTIKSVRQASGARIEVDDVKKTGGGEDCVILITSVESPDDLKSMTIEAVLLLQEKINDEGDETVTIRLLVSQKVIGCIIGRSGSIINEIRNRTKANISISKGKKPKCASDSEELIEVVGKVASVRDALVQIVLRLRDDVLKERESDHKSSAVPEPIYSGGTSFQRSSVMPNIPPVPRSSYEHRDDIETRFDNLPSKPRYGHGSLPTREEEYESFSSYSEKPYRGLPPPSTLEMVVPGHAVGKVLGKGGANIANIRKISGADVEISDSKSSRGDRVAFISGTSDQKRSAENLIQAFIMAT